MLLRALLFMGLLALCMATETCSEDDSYNLLEWSLLLRWVKEVM